MEAQKDCLVRAISKDGFVNAVAVYTRGLTERARQIHHTSPVATAALGRALAACSMMGNALKDNGASVTMQIKGDGPLVGGTAKDHSSFGLRNFHYGYTLNFGYSNIGFNVTYYHSPLWREGAGPQVRQINVGISLVL